MAVMAIFLRTSLSSTPISMARSSRTSMAFLEAILYPPVMMVGWMLASIRSTAFFRSSPAITTAVVVPSPHSSSWVLATSTSILAAGCSTSISLSMVTPSLVMTTSPMESTSILSIPLGPRALLTASAIALAAMMLLYWASLPLSRLVPSFSISMGVLPYPISLPPVIVLLPITRKYVSLAWLTESKCLFFYIKLEVYLNSIIRCHGRRRVSVRAAEIFPSTILHRAL